MADDKKSEGGSWVVGLLGLAALMVFLVRGCSGPSAPPEVAQAIAAPAPAPVPQRDFAAEAAADAKRAADKTAGHNAALAVAGMMESTGVWHTLVADLDADERYPEMLSVMMNPSFEAMPRQKRLALAKSIEQAWSIALPQYRADAKNFRVKIIDLKGHKIGGSTLFGGIEVDSD